MATQMNALKQGFQEILPLDSIKMFDEKEVEVRMKSKIKRSYSREIYFSF